MIIGFKQFGIDPNQPNDRMLMQQLQGNILRTHGYRLTTCMIGQFTNTDDFSIDNKIVNLMTDRISSEWDVHVRRDKTAQDGNTLSDQPCFIGFYLSKHGYNRLDWKYNGHNVFPSIAESYKKEVHYISKSSPLWFTEKNEAREIDFIILVAHDEQNAIDESIKSIQTDLKKKGVATIIGTVSGQIYASKSKTSRDPFGFRDGLKQPRFYRSSRPHGSECDVPLSPLDIAIRDGIDPCGPGSFLAVRHYLTHADQLKRDYPENEDQAKIMGRSHEGIRVNGCPNSHVSRMIGSDTDEEKTDRPRIVRRGFVFPADKKNKEGLFFMSFQADIKDQFERILYWANQTQIHAAPHNHARCDELIGQNCEAEINPKYVTLLGGEYFFAPPIARFRSPNSCK